MLGIASYFPYHFLIKPQAPPRRHAHTKEGEGLWQSEEEDRDTLKCLPEEIWQKAQERENMGTVLKGQCLLGTDGKGTKENSLWKGSKAKEHGVLERQAEA